MSYLIFYFYFQVKKKESGDDTDAVDTREETCTNGINSEDTHKSTSIFTTDAPLLAQDTLSKEEWQETTIERVPLTDYIEKWSMNNSAENPYGPLVIGYSLSTTDDNLVNSKPTQSTEGANLCKSTCDSYNTFYGNGCTMNGSSQGFSFGRPSTQPQSQYLRSNIMIREMSQAPALKSKKHFEASAGNIAGPMEGQFPIVPVMKVPVFGKETTVQFHAQPRKPVPDNYSMPHPYGNNIQFNQAYPDNALPTGHVPVPWGAPASQPYTQFTTTLPQNMFSFNKGQPSFTMGDNFTTSTSDGKGSLWRHSGPFVESLNKSYSSLDRSDTFSRLQIKPTRVKNGNENAQADVPVKFGRNGLYLQKYYSPSTVDSIRAANTECINGSSRGECQTTQETESALHQKKRFFSEDGKVCYTNQSPALAKDYQDSSTEDSMCGTSPENSTEMCNEEIGSNGDIVNGAEETPAEKSNLPLNMTPNEEKIFKMSTLDFTKLINKSSDSDANHLKKLRRTLKNRNYATQCRIKRNKRFDTLQINYREIQLKHKRQTNKMKSMMRDCINLTNENVALAKQISEAEQRNNQLKAENEGLRNFITDVLTKTGKK